MFFESFENWQIRVSFPQNSFECVETIFFQVAKSENLSKLKRNGLNIVRKNGFNIVIWQL
jgi:hypothetical protein